MLTMSSKPSSKSWTSKEKCLPTSTSMRPRTPSSPRTVRSSSARALPMKLVEVVQGPHVSDETAHLSLALCERLEKVGVHLKKEVEGFLLNRIIRAITLEAFWLLEMGVASFEDIDKAQVYGAGHPMGAFRLLDLTGIDLAYIRMTEKFRETG